MSGGGLYLLYVMGVCLLVGSLLGYRYIGRYVVDVGVLVVYLCRLFVGYVVVVSVCRCRCISRVFGGCRCGDSVFVLG